MALEFKRNQQAAEERLKLMNEEFKTAGINAVVVVDWDTIAKDSFKANIAKWCSYQSQFSLLHDLDGIFQDNIGKEAFNETFNKIVFSGASGDSKVATPTKDGKTLKIHYVNDAWKTGDGYGQGIANPTELSKAVENMLG